MDKRKWLRWNGFQDLRMEWKLCLVFLLLITVPMSFISYFSYHNYSNSVDNNTVVYSENLIAKMIARIDDYIEDMERISSIPAYVDDVKQNLGRSNRYFAERKGNGDQGLPTDFPLLLSIQRGIEGNISFINNMKRGASSVYIFDQYGNGYYSTKAGGIRQNIKESYKLWKSRAADSKGEALLFSTQQYTNNLQTTRYAFTIVRNILDKSLNNLGMIAIDANISVLENQIMDLDKVTHGKSVIIDGEGYVIFDSDKQLLTRNIAENPRVLRAAGAKGSFYDAHQGEDYLNIYATSGKTGWKVLTSIPVSELRKDTNMIRNVTWAATLITIAVALLISIVLSFALTKPLRKMMKLMKQVQEGNLRVQFQVKYKDEIGQLGNQFNRMVLRINQLINDIYLMESQKKEAELNALQNQINPHFMYNTLESIRMMAEMNDDTEVADMISLLGRLLRYSISDLSRRVTIGDELEHVQNYVEILNYRYPNRFRLEMDITEQVRQYPLIKLVMQPIVENAIYHGMNDDNPSMNIRISGRQTDDHVMVSVEDDGIGMDQDTLDRLNRTLSMAEESKQARGGIGLKNVNQRIKLHYGEASGLRVFSREGKGTRVDLLLPLPLPRLTELPVPGRRGSALESDNR